MFLYNQKFLNKITNFLAKSYNFDKHIKLYEINFQKPWWEIIWKQKAVFALALVSDVIQSVYDALIPIIIGYAFINQKIEYIYAFFVGYIVLEIINRIIIKRSLIFALQTSQSIKLSAYKYFLTIDPIFHSTKSSGQITSKIDRGSSNLEDGINSLINGIVPTLTRFFTVVVAVSTLNPLLALVSISSFVFILLFQYLAINLNIKSFYQVLIHKGDTLSAIAIENLQQNALIRSSFATNNQYEKTIKSVKQNTIARSNFYFTNGIITTVVRLIYILSVTFIILVIFGLVRENKMETSFAIAFVISYLNGSVQIMRLGQVIQNFSEKLASVIDLFSFIRDFGKQTYPVLKKDK